RATLYLDTSPDPVLVHLHEAPAGAAPAVLIVPPFGWDDVASHRARRRWAERLAADGSPAARLDLPGTGDSAGGASDPGRLTAWAAAVAGAAAWLRARSGDRRVVALGLGLGGLVAWKAAAEGAAIDDLALWGVPARGRSLVRELQAFAALKQDEWGDGPPPADARRVTDGFDVTGYVIAQETADALTALDLTALPLPAAAGRRVLLLDRDGVPVDRRLREHAAAAGLDLQEAPGPGWGAMTSGPQESVFPEEAAGAVAGWLRGAPGAPGVAAAETARELPELALHGATEGPWTAVRAFGRQFGVLARPGDGGHPRPLGLVLLNAGAVRHTGPNRMWVEAARRWAPRGVPVLRLDIEGLGDSDGDERPYVDSARLYEPRLAEQAVAAVEDLVAAGVADRWLVAGLCAGASWAFHAVLHGGEHVPAAVLVNPFAFYWEDELVAEREMGAARRLRGVDGWRRLLSGSVTPDRVRTVAVHALRTPVERGRRRQRAQRRVRRDEGDLDRLRDAGKQLTMLIGRDEPILDRFQRDGILERLDRWPNVALHRLPTRDHTFRAPWLQDRVHAALDAAVTAELERRRERGH
ncbi:MAG: hypothetical protein QOI80_2624, partial [Solirubrobacteraceae bacterium]|nr:hypothetical protein [Solirubrobacteraceae bacterium]